MHVNYGNQHFLIKLIGPWLSRFQFQVVGTAFCHFLISQFLFSIISMSWLGLGNGVFIGLGESETHSSVYKCKYSVLGGSEPQGSRKFAHLILIPILPKAFVSLYRCVTLRDVNLTYEFICKKLHSFTTVVDFYTMASFCDMKM